VLDVDAEAVDFSWFGGGKLNVAFNCVDRHAKKRPGKPAIIWAKNEPGEYQVFPADAVTAVSAMPQGSPIEQLSRNSVHAPTPHLRQTQVPFG